MNALITLVSQTDLTTTNDLTDSQSLGVVGVVSIIGIIVLVLTLVAMWKIFVKLGEPGWKGLIPIYNFFKIYELSGKSGWLVLLFFLPCVNLVAAWLLADSLGDMFGKGFGYKLGLFFFPGLMHLVLGFGSSQPVSVPGGSGGQVPPLAAG